MIEETKKEVRKPRKTKKKVVKNGQKADSRDVRDIKVGDILAISPEYYFEEGEDLVRDCPTEIALNTREGTQEYNGYFVVRAGKIILRIEDTTQVVEIYVDSGESSVIIIQ